MDGIRAEESLLLSEAMAVGSGSMKPESSRSVVRSWKRRAEADSEPVMTPEQRISAVSAMGIGVVEEKS